MTRRAALRAGCLSLPALVVGGAVVDRLAWRREAPNPSPVAGFPENGLWIHWRWHRAASSESDLDGLTERVQRGGIRNVYLHVRSVRPDGSLRYPQTEHSSRVIAGLHRRAPEARVLAWIYAGNRRGRGAVDLSVNAVRAKMVADAVRLVQSGGFDGVQWDYEICADGEPGFLRLLEETRNSLPRKAVLSVATPLWLPAPFRRWGWSDAAFTQTAKRCDQICVLAYDSGLWLPRAYERLVKEQVVHVSRAVAAGNPRCRLILGLPTYEEGGLSHDPRSENLATALRGVADGLADPRTERSVFAGAALFAEYTTDEAEWDEFLGKGG